MKKSTIVVLLPGIAGTTLTHGLLPVWPEKVALAALASEKLALALLTDKTLKPGEPIPWTLPITIFDLGYRKFRDFFMDAGFESTVFSRDDQDLPKEPVEKLLVAFAYDWRQDNGATDESAGTVGDLRTLLAALHARYGGADYEVFLVGHSMGGLVSRAYLENPTFRQDPWFAKIQALVTLGTPHLGAPLGVDAITGSVTEVPFLHNYDELVQDFVNESYSVSAYELLPPRQQGFIRVDGTEYSIFDPQFQTTPAWTFLKQKGLNEAKIQRAGQFLSGLDYTGGEGLPPYYCVYGISSLFRTRQSFTYDEATDRLLEMGDFAGDTIVPRRSASFEGRAVAGVYTPPGDVNHLQLAGNDHILQQVAAWIGITTPVVHFTGIETPAATSV